MKKKIRSSIFLIGITVFFTFLYCSSPINQARVKVQGTLLPNGIELPEEWPPKHPVPEVPVDMPVPYLANVPDIIPVNTGRQLFVDDFLIEKTDLTRVFLYPHYFKGNPVLEPDKPWEYSAAGYPYAAPFSDGIWYDEKDKKFKMWYSTGGGDRFYLKNSALYSFWISKYKTGESDGYTAGGEPALHPSGRDTRLH